MSLLIKYHVDVNHQDKSGQTPVHEAINGSRFELALLLVKQGADPKIKNHLGKGYSAIDTIKRSGNSFVILDSDAKVYPELINELKRFEQGPYPYWDKDHRKTSIE